MHALIHQRMGSIQHPLDGELTETLLATGDVAFGELQIVENTFRIGPLAEDIVVLEEVIMPECGVGDDQRLHGRAIFLHQIVDAGIAVDHQLIGKPAKPLAIEHFIGHELLPERPMFVK